jgi:hypothetical protein
MTEVKELEQEFLTKQEKATAILYNHTEPQFSVDHDLTEYNQIREAKYADIMMQEPTMQEYAEPLPVMDRYAPTAITETVKAPAEFQTYVVPTLPVRHAPAQKAPAPKAPAVIEIAQKPVDIEQEQPDEATDENVEYVFKLKTPLIVAVACIAVVFLLLSVLLVVNTVNIAKANVELRQLQNEQIIAEQSLGSARAEANLAKAQAIAEIESNYATEYTALPQGSLPANYDRYSEPVNLKSSTNTFDAICEFLSKIF